MSRALLVLHDDAIRARALDWVKRAPPETRVTFQGPRRSLDQNSRFWAMLTDVSRQKEHCGRKYAPEQWKVLFLSALGREMQFAPSLDGTGFVPLGQSSSSLSVAEMSDLMEFMSAWGAENGIEWSEPQKGAPPAPRCGP